MSEIYLSRLEVTDDQGDVSSDEVLFTIDPFAIAVSVKGAYAQLSITLSSNPTRGL